MPILKGTGMARKLDRNRPFAECIGSNDGTRYEQDGLKFRADGTLNQPEPEVMPSPTPAEEEYRPPNVVRVGRVPKRDDELEMDEIKKRMRKMGMRISGRAKRETLLKSLRKAVERELREQDISFVGHEPICQLMDILDA